MKIILNSTKICSKCRVEKEISNFTKDSRNKDKLCYWCKECLYARNKENFQKRLLAGPTVIRSHKVCITCGQAKEISEFYNNKKGYTSDGYGSYCKLCWPKNIKYWAHRRRKNIGGGI